MTDAAIIQAEYVEWKMVKTRKSLQLIFELPLEQQELVQKALGTPMPDTSTPVAICRLNPALLAQSGQGQQPEPEAHQIEGPANDAPRPPARLSQIAGIICGEGAFATFMRERHGYDCEPAEAVRLFCGIESRRELDDTINSSARANFMSLRSGYEAWLKCEEAA